MADAVRAPTLMDLKDIVQAEISEVSTIFALKSFGGLIGTIATGLLLDYFQPSVNYIFLAGTFFIKSLMTLLLPYCPNLLMMQGAEFIFGVCHGGFHSVANQLLLSIWTGSGRNISPYMYTLHFSYAIGALVTPIISKPFLRSELDSTVNSTMFDLTELELGNFQIWTVKTLYPLIFIIMIVPVPFFIYYFVQEKNKELLVEKSTEEELKCQEQEEDFLSRKKTILLMIFASQFYFTMAGIELGFRSFTPVFCVNSALGLTRNEGADVLAILYVTFAAGRGLLIPISTLVSSSTIVWTSTLTLLVSTSMLSVWAESSIILLQVGIALTGAGISALFAGCMLWIQNFIRLNNRLTAIICFSCRISEQVFSLATGMIIENYPMSFLYLMSGNVVFLIAAFSIMNIIVNRN